MASEAEEEAISEAFGCYVRHFAASFVAHWQRTLMHKWWHQDLVLMMNHSHLPKHLVAFLRLRPMTSLSSFSSDDAKLLG